MQKNEESLHAKELSYYSRKKKKTFQIVSELLCRNYDFGAFYLQFS